MAVHDIYSKRLKKTTAAAVDVFSYDEIPLKLRAQIVQILQHSFGRGFSYNQSLNAWKVIVDILKREYGIFELTDGNFSDDLGELCLFLINSQTDQFLDAVELACQVLESIGSEYLFNNKPAAEEEAQAALQEINIRFRESAVGYEYKSGLLIKIDSEFIHSEAVLPALVILHLNKIFEGAESEFLKAHSYYRQGDGSSTLLECCKSFESIMKAICQKRGWVFDAQRDTASKLVDICMTKGLIPGYWQTHFSGLRSVLESALPTARNRSGGHGTGASPTNVPIELARYVLHMTASTLLFLAEADERLP